MRYEYCPNKKCSPFASVFHNVDYNKRPHGKSIIPLFNIIMFQTLRNNLNWNLKIVFNQEQDY